MWIFALAAFAVVALEVIREDLANGYALVPSEVM